MPDTPADSKPLDLWLADQEHGFPARPSISYLTRFKSVSEYLTNEIHPHVEKGALVHDDGFLTNHGPGHITTVIQRASDLLRHPPDSYPQLNAYEVYLLLMAIHFHDVGNVYGRKEHEQKHQKILRRLGDLVGDDMVEKQAILKIARAHGGRTNGDRDTIARLPREDPVLDQQVRYQALAAILRFADELADDSRRTSRALQALGVIPERSQAFHMYAQALQAVQIQPDSRLVRLRFYLTRDHTARVGKGDGQVYLIDYIYERTVKMHFEREYCMRFTYGLVRIDAIDVRIEVYTDDSSPDPCIEPIAYRLEQRGYPGSPDITIHELVSGQHLKRGHEVRQELEGE